MLTISVDLISTIVMITISVIGLMDVPILVNPLLIRQIIKL